MDGCNVLVIVSDEHARDMAGCYGSTLAQTPNLDVLAQRGTVFNKAYTPSPICVPARASLATGRWVHDIGFWSNAQPYDGSVEGWGHRLVENGRRCVSIGKLHYRCVEDDNGFDEEIVPLHVKGGLGWTRGLLGRDGSPWGAAAHFADEIGPGLCDYNRYDMRVARETVDWLANVAPGLAQPWTLYASFVSPHYPLIVPQEFYDLYPPDSLEPPRFNRPEEMARNPVVAAMRAYMNYDDYFDDHTRLVAKASYLGLVSFLDRHIGQVLATLEASGQLENTLVIYTSDHGDCVGNHGIWTKCCMFEESAAIPMVIAGPGVPARQAIDDEQVSLVDIHATVLEASGLGLSESDRALPSRDLVAIANGARHGRCVLSEYHDGGSITGMFMVRVGDWKYNAYPGYPPELYDLANDPHEAHDLGESPEHADVRAMCAAKLAEICDVDAVNAQAFADQEAKIAELGGRQAILDSPNYDFTPIPV